MEDEQIITIEPEAQEGVVLDSLQELAKNTISSVIVLKGNLKKKREELNDKLLENPMYRNASEAAKEAGKLKADMRKRALQNPEAARLNADLTDLRAEVKDKQLALFDYLLEYHNMAKVNQIEDNTGEVHDILIEAKIKI